MVINSDFWRGKTVFITGHTGFKGSWLTVWLSKMGANIVGYSVDVPSNPSLFELGKLDTRIEHISGDVRDYSKLSACVKECAPDILFHLAAQPLVRRSYEIPRETYEVNVMGTVNVLEVIRGMASIKSAVIVTTDKCYDNKEWVFGYREIDALGGHDPYSSSKGAAEIVASAYNKSFFRNSGQVICSARAGNVIGGGDWAEDRLIPDIVKSIWKGEPVKIRNPDAIRPWQHVLEPLSGYLLLAQRAFRDDSVRGAWNFGPPSEENRTVRWVTDQIAQTWGAEDVWTKDGTVHPHEANYLKLDSSKALIDLHWKTNWSIEAALVKTTNWYKDYYTGQLNTPDKVYQRCITDLEDYLNAEIK